jgi:hypothetical protein
VDRYDFVNGAPAVGATLDLYEAPALFERAYGHKSGRRNLHRYFVHTDLPEIHYPERPWHTSNDPVLSPALMDHFFNQRTRGFDGMDDRRKHLLHSIYGEPEWAAVLPTLPPAIEADRKLRRHARHSMKCPASLDLLGAADSPDGPLPLTVLEISAQGFLARSPQPLPVGARCHVVAELGNGVPSRVQAEVVRSASSDAGRFYGFHVERPDAAWQRCVAWLEDAAALAARPAASRPAVTGSSA